MDVFCLYKYCIPSTEKNKFLIFFIAIGFCIEAFSQTASYSLIGTKIKSPSSVEITLMTYATKKKSVEKEANCAALHIIMFDGLAGTIYNKPLLDKGLTVINENPVYFENLFNSRLSDFIKCSKMLSKFKKAEKGKKSTIYCIEVNYIQLRKDLEKNNIKTQLGL